MTAQERKSTFVYGYNQEPNTFYSASGFVNIIGKRLVKFDNAVLPAVMSFGIYLLLHKNNEKCTNFCSLNEPDAIQIEIEQQIPEYCNSWIKLPLTVTN